MSRLWTDVIQTYLDSQGGMSAAALARKAGLSAQTMDQWKRSRPEAENLRKLARAVDVDYAILLAVVDADGGYITDDDLEAALEGKWINPEMRARLRRHINPGKPDTGPAGG